MSITASASRLFLSLLLYALAILFNRKASTRKKRGSKAIIVILAYIFIHPPLSVPSS